MAENPWNKFNGEKPFDLVRAEDFGGDLYEFYEPLEKLIREVSGVDITGSRPVILIGGRGTGKTMVLKFLSIEMQLKDFLKNTNLDQKKIDNLAPKYMKDFLNKKTYIGIYLRFKTTEYGAFKGDLGSLFMPYLSIKIAEQVFSTLLLLKRSNLISSVQETKIIEYFISQIIFPKIGVIKYFEDILEIIRKDIIKKFEVIFECSSYYSRDELIKELDEPILISKNIVFGLPEFIFTNVKYLNGKYLFILLDEFEFLNEMQIRIISKLIKDSNETVSFKIGSRHMPAVLPIGDTNEVLQEVHDFRKINITDALNAAKSKKKGNYNKLIKSILNKRLEKSEFFKGNGISNVNQLFPNLDLKEEAQILVSSRENKEAHWSKFRSRLKESSLSSKEIDGIIDDLKYPQDPIIEKLNMLLYLRGYSSAEVKNMYYEYLNRRN
jgi:hypothetical protein